VLEATGAGAPPFARAAPWQENHRCSTKILFALPEHVVGETMSGRLLSHRRGRLHGRRGHVSSLGSARAGLWAD
jgi:hypothetical protein